MADMFLGGSFVLVAFGCQHFVVGGRKLRWTWCVFNVGGENVIFVGGNMFSVRRNVNLSSVSFVCIPAVHLNPSLIIPARAPSFVASPRAVAVAAVAPTFLRCTADKASRVRREFKSAFEGDTQLLADFCSVAILCTSCCRNICPHSVSPRKGAPPCSICICFSREGRLACSNRATGCSAGCSCL